MSETTPTGSEYTAVVEDLKTKIGRIEERLGYLELVLPHLVSIVESLSVASNTNLHIMTNTNKILETSCGAQDSLIGQVEALSSQQGRVVEYVSKLTDYVIELKRETTSRS